MCTRTHSRVKHTSGKLILNAWELVIKPTVCSAANSDDAAFSNTFILHLENGLEKSQAFLLVEKCTDVTAEAAED